MNVMQQTDQKQDASAGKTPLSPSTQAYPAPSHRLLQQVPAAVSAMRPKQWSKNGLVLLALIFSHNLTNISAIGRVLLAFGAFSLAASTIYIVNDLVDRKSDRIHPTKSLRAVASGRL